MKDLIRHLSLRAARSPAFTRSLQLLDAAGGERPDLIVSGINHGSNLGDDVTYSGTVAAAFEGIVLCLPALAVSQQSGIGGMGYAGRGFDFSVAARIARELVVRATESPLAAL